MRLPSKSRRFHLQVQCYLLFIFTLITANLFSQKSTISIGVNQYVNPSFRYMQQVFCFARPWLPQTPNYLQYGLHLSYQNQLRDSNTNFSWRLTTRIYIQKASVQALPSYQMYTIDPNLCYKLSSKHRFQLQVGVGLTLMGMKRNQYEKTTVLDSEFETAYGVGIDINTRLTKEIKTTGFNVYVEVNAQPLTYFRDAEVLFNDTKGLYGNTFTQAILSSAGICWKW